MPRVYIVTIILSIMLGMMIGRWRYVGSITLIDLLVTILILSTIYVNEKKAWFEDLISKRERRRIGMVVILLILLGLLWTLSEWAPILT